MTAPEPFTTPALQAIGVVRAGQRLHHEAPRQSGLGRGGAGEIHVRQGLQNCLRDLAGFSHVWVLSWCHLARGFRSLVTPPRDRQKRGLFATRAPQRPNPIGLSCVRLVRIDKRVLHIEDHDLLDGTPVLDIKPYLAYCDSVPGASMGYAASLPDDAADHRAWWEQKEAPMPRLYARRLGRPGPQVR
jgi:tRNA-Thr(GGU) m(6)t(6)A37 methyltransferase TsaA